MVGSEISMEKSTLYLAGIQASNYQAISNHFSFDIGQLPVRYLGLPLVTKRLSSADSLPLIEQIRHRIGTWTSRFLSYAGRLNLISSVLSSITNFLMAAFRLPRACLREINKICSAFFMEGGLGLRSLKEANDVCCLKLIWRILSHGDSLWVKWIETNLLKNNSFWIIKSSTTMGSWMWKKLLKYREVAKTFSKIEVHNGQRTSFWYDDWSCMGRIMNFIGDKGIIDLGIKRDKLVAEVWDTHRSRRHITDYLNQVENVIATSKANRKEKADDVVWRGRNDIYKPQFSTRDTWNNIRTTATKVTWYKGVWFYQATPKFSFCVWLAALDRLSTGDRMANWKGVSSGSCVFCNHPTKSRDHLFFNCPYSSEVWTVTAKNILTTRFTTDWHLLLNTVSSLQQNRVENFLVRYAFQASVYSIWSERNRRRHGNTLHSATRLIGWIDKQVRNILSSIRIKGDRHYDAGLQMWFDTRA
ncbi:putative reverse transcriptase zinc-binding domain-containing protein [Arabidopsis thaliana]